MSRRARHEDGTVIPLILLFVLIAAFVVMAGSATSSAFLAQRDLQSVCDAAAVKAANGVDEGSLYSQGSLQHLPLTDASVQDALAGLSPDYRSSDPGLTMTGTASPDGATASVTCHRTVRIPFGAFFGHADGLPRTAESSANAPVRN